MRSRDRKGVRVSGQVRERKCECVRMASVWSEDDLIVEERPSLEGDGDHLVTGIRGKTYPMG